MKTYPLFTRRPACILSGHYVSAFPNSQKGWQTTAGGGSQAPEYIKFSEEIGEWGGNIREAKLPDYFEVDYVRVYDAVAK